MLRDLIAIADTKISTTKSAYLPTIKHCFYVQNLEIGEETRLQCKTQETSIKNFLNFLRSLIFIISVNII